MTNNDKIEIRIRYIETNTGVERTGTCTSLSEEGAAAVAVDRLGATELESGDYIYRAPEAGSGSYYVVDASEMARLGAALHCRSGSDCYSLWCAETGREATDAEIAEISR